MRLTLLRAKEALAHRCPADRLEYRLNRVSERLLTNGKYVGSTARIAIAAPYGQLTLPRRFRTVEGVKVDGFVYELGNQWYEFLPGRSDARGYSLAAVRDLGDEHPILYTPRVDDTAPLDATIPVNDIPVGGTITIDFAGTDPDLTVDIYGFDVNGMPAELHFSGETTQANVFARISRIHKEIGNVSVRVTFTTDDAIQTVIAMMEPKEEETCYRRYLIDRLKGCENVAVAALVKRRHIEFTDDQDVLPIGNISALEKGMDALNYEDENDLTLANQYWGTAIGILNDELKDTTSADEFPTIRFKYPGRTAPRLTSFY